MCDVSAAKGVLDSRFSGPVYMSRKFEVVERINFIRAKQTELFDSCNACTAVSMSYTSQNSFVSHITFICSKVLICSAHVSEVSSKGAAFRDGDINI